MFLHITVTKSTYIVLHTVAVTHCVNLEFRGKVGQIVSTGDKYLAAVEENKVHICCKAVHKVF